MLDDLLGRTELKRQISALEDERDSLQARLDAESDRRAQAVRARQEADERINRLEDRIADLEGKVDTNDDDTRLDFRRRDALRGDRVDEVLSRLDSFKTAEEGVITAFIDDDVPPACRELLDARVGLLSRATPCIVCADDAGILAVALRPPVSPEPFVEWGSAVRLDRSWFRPTGRFALALVRSDTFAVGIYEGETRVDFEGFTSDVKSDHSKGGFSQGRFERIRDGQIADHIDRCTEVLDGIDVDRLYVVGDRRLVSGFDADTTAAVDATGNPKPALDDAFEDFWTTQLYVL